MKRISKYRILAVLVMAIIFIAACTKETSDVKLDPKLSTSMISNLTSDSVTVIGFVVAAGDGFTERGVCYSSTDTIPTTAASKVIYSGKSTQATFNVGIKTNRLTKYYARAYAINANGTLYGDKIIFTTPAALPILASINTSVLANTPDKGITAATAINITDDGGPDATANITARGVVYGMYSHPTTDSTKSKLVKNRTFATSEGTGKGQFTSLATNLKGNVKYYLRAYATNKIGTVYSNEVSFTTPVAYPTITTNPATLITKTTATFNGKFTYSGGGTVSERGFCYGLTANPTTSATKIPVTAASDSTIAYNVTGLTLNTSYHVRAYVINETGTNYGADVQFTTLSNIVTLWIAGDYQGWNPGGATDSLMSALTSPIVQGYAYISTTGGFKFVSQKNWNGPNYGAGANAGTLSTDASAGNLSVSTPGYYFFSIDLTNLTYTATKTAWGIIGDATAGGWSTQTDMTYSSTSRTFSLAAHLTSGGNFKFRGTSDWNVNYGSDKADGTTLNAGGANIPISVTGDYAITLNLSHPNAYTYSANRWGIIGDATTGGWSTSTPMTWDAQKKVFTITLDLNISGSFKFRANDAWDYALGGTLGALSSTAGAPNLTVAVAGNYTVTLDPWALVATATKN